MSENEKKIKVLMISDHPMAPSGVGGQTKYIITALLDSGKFKVSCLGGAVKHDNYEPQKTHDYGEDFIIYPIDGYGNAESIRSILWAEKPDILWFMTDPRFYGWLWEIENEVRDIVPMVYYHVWDNYPYPDFNKDFYNSTDVIASISKVTHDIVNNVAPDVENHYVPHAVMPDIFKKLPDEDIENFKAGNFGEEKDRFTFFWNNRNARRKQSGSLIYWFNEFANKVGPDKVRLIMHTDPHDPNGPDLYYLLKALKVDPDTITISHQKVEPAALAVLYNAADCTINISDAEGFGLATLESLSCGTPIIVNMTGGLQEQVTDGEEWFGIGIEPNSKSVIGSQQVPFIYEDRIGKEDFIAALEKMYYMSEEERALLGAKGMEHVQKNYNFEKFQERWIELMENVYKKHGSWSERKGYKSWTLKEVA
jgi:glycosyltransferase involved in cell wall biosynthesis